VWPPDHANLLKGGEQYARHRVQRRPAPNRSPLFANSSRHERDRGSTLDGPTRQHRSLCPLLDLPTPGRDRPVRHTSFSSEPSPAPLSWTVSSRHISDLGFVFGSWCIYCLLIVLYTHLATCQIRACTISMIFVFLPTCFPCFHSVIASSREQRQPQSIK